MAGDTFSTGPNEGRWIWLTVASWALVFREPTFVENLQGKMSRGHVPDFFQEYASARNWFEGLPVYTDHHETALGYLGILLDDKRSSVLLNAHPPT